jgi:hypothetical protein
LHSEIWGWNWELNKGYLPSIIPELKNALAERGSAITRAEKLVHACHSIDGRSILWFSNDAVLLPLLAARSRWMMAIAYRYSDGRSTGRPCLCQSIRSSCSLPSIKAGRWTRTWTNVRTLEIDLLLFAVCTHGIYLCSRAVLPALISPAHRLCKSCVMGKHDQVTLSLTHTVCGLCSAGVVHHPSPQEFAIHTHIQRSIDLRNQITVTE